MSRGLAFPAFFAWALPLLNGTAVPQFPKSVTLALKAQEQENLKRLSIREMRKELTQLDKLMRQEPEIIITRHGKPIARLLPLHTKQGIQSRTELRASMKRLKVGSESHIRAERNER